MGRLPIACLALLIVALSACQAPFFQHASPRAGNGALESGDIVFQDSSPHSGQAAQIKALTRSHWSHCGIYFAQPGGGAVVIDGNGVGPVVSWETWQSRGARGQYAAYRMHGGLTETQARQLRTAADRYDGLPYDLKFAWGNEAIYCSELVWKSYHDALGQEVGKVQKLRDFDLNSTLARPLIVREGSWGTVENAKADGDEPVVSPQAIAESDRLTRVH